MATLNFPKPNFRTDAAAGRVQAALDKMKLPSKARNFTVIVAELSSGEFLIGVSGSTRDALELRIAKTLGPGYLVCTGLSSIRTKALNPQIGFKRFGLHYGRFYDCAEPKVLEGIALLGQSVRGWTVLWYGQPTGKKGKNPYPDTRSYIGSNAHGVSLIKPCHKCVANEKRLMAYVDQGFAVHGKPKFGSYESPF